ncbi:MFS transporter [Streptomyces sp. NPDC051133]|uniref:MFS transporter n=1 Tax=Streptomyces sp. NPDC051133 TaxID=3155521 RepID=UPI00343EF485
MTGTTGLPGLYAVVTVLGVTYAPHLVTVFGLLERAVAPSRLAEAMGTATSALVGGQALSVAVTGRLADSYGPAAAFAAGSAAAALAFALALTTRPTTYQDHEQDEDQDQDQAHEHAKQRGQGREPEPGARENAAPAPVPDEQPR